MKTPSAPTTPDTPKVNDSAPADPEIGKSEPQAPLKTPGTLKTPGNVESGVPDLPSRKPMTPEAAAATLKENFKMLQDDRFNLARKSKLRELLNSPNTDPKLKEALQYVENNPAVFNAIDSSDGWRPLSITEKGLDKFLAERKGASTPIPADRELTDDETVKILKRNDSILTSGIDGKTREGFHEGDVRTILKQNPGLPDDFKAAANRFLSNSGLRYKIDDASWDGTAGVWDGGETYTLTDLKRYGKK